MGDSPLWLICPVARRTRTLDDLEVGTYPEGHRLVRTGQERPNPSRRIGPRSSYVERQIRCSCGYIGWTRHIDAENLRLER